jgi:hypothetical protein
MVAIDLAAVLLFVVIGRAAHSHGLAVAGVASTAWPFLSGMAVGWLILAARRHEGASFSGGLIVCVSTVALGMSLRIIAGQGIAVAFVLVAMAFLGAAMLGSRTCLRNTGS